MLFRILSASGASQLPLSPLALRRLARLHSSGKRVLRPLVVCGPSGVGKSSLIQRVVRGNEDLFEFSVSHTTRRPRPGEQHGVDYLFATEEEMRAAIERGEFLEYAEVHGNLYGTSVAAVKRVHQNNKVCVLDIDVQGVKSFKAHAAAKELNPLFVFIAPPSIQDLAKRLIHRGTEAPESFQRRMEKAPEIVEFGTTPGNFDAVIVNDELDRAQAELESKLEEWFPQFSAKKKARQADNSAHR